MADVLVESNEIGNTVLYILNYDKEYENIIRTFDKTGRALLGQKTTSKTKSVGCARFKDMVESEKLIIRDHKTFGELRHFCLSGTSYEAEQGFHDDYIMGLVNLSYYASTPQFKNKYESNFSDEFQREFDEKIMEEKMTWIVKNSTEKKVPILNNDNVDRYNAQVISPIVSEGDTIGSVILMATGTNSQMGDVEIKLAQSAAGFLGKQMEQ